jgi:hypothetical protein
MLQILFCNTVPVICRQVPLSARPRDLGRNRSAHDFYVHCHSIHEFLAWVQEHACNDSCLPMLTLGGTCKVAGRAAKSTHLSMTSFGLNIALRCTSSLAEMIDGLDSFCDLAY